MANLKAFNIDETEFITEHSPRKIICNENSKSQVVECNLSSWITVTAACNSLRNYD